MGCPPTPADFLLRFVILKSQSAMGALITRQAPQAATP